MRRALIPVGLALSVLAGGGRRAAADFWDVQIQNDDTVNTENELVHGSDQFHDLVAHAGSPLVADLDYYRLRQDRSASYEVVVDSTSGDIGPGTSILSRVTSAGANVQTSQVVSPNIGFSLSLRWENTTAAEIFDQRILVKSASCTTACTVVDVYRVRAFETTYAIPRFNNTNGQVTTLMLQNGTAYTISGNIWFWSSTGTLLAQSPFSLPAKNLLVLNTATIAAVAATSGSVTISHNARYGDLSGKAVAVEGATGFTFDTPMVPRVR